MVTAGAGVRAFCKFQLQSMPQTCDKVTALRRERLRAGSEFEGRTSCLLVDVTDRCSHRELHKQAGRYEMWGSLGNWGGEDSRPLAPYRRVVSVRLISPVSRTHVLCSMRVRYF